MSGPHGTWISTAGLADVSAGHPMTANARMRLSRVSASSWWPWWCCSSWRNTRCASSDTVAHRLPGLLPYGSRITVRELLNMTSGLIETNDIGRNLAHFISDVE